MTKKLIRLSANRELINYSCKELPYTKIVYNLSPAKFGRSYGLGFITVYILTLVGYLYFCFSTKDTKVLFNISLSVFFLNFLWFSGAFLLRRDREKKWMKRCSNCVGLKFSDALFMARLEKIKNKIQQLEINAGQIAVIISELDSQRKEQLFKIGTLFAVLGGAIALANDSLKEILKFYLQAKIPMVVSAVHVSIIALVVPFTYLIMAFMYKLDYGQWKVKSILKEILQEIELNKL